MEGRPFYGADTMNRSLSLADWGLLLSASVLVGSTFLFANIAVKEISPLVVAALRAMISAVICWVVMRAYGARLPSTRQGWIALFWLGLLTGAIPFGTMAWGQQHIDSGMGGILFGTMPILAVVLTPLLLAEEVFTRRALVGGVVGFAGIILLMGPSVLANASDQILGMVITFLGPCSHTLGAIYTRRQTGLDPRAMVTGSMIFGSVVLVPLAFAVEAPLSLNPGMGAIGALLAFGILTGTGFSVYFVVIRRVGAMRSSLVPLFFPVVAVALGAVVLGERLPVEAFAGLALILAGAFAVSTRRQAEAPAPAAPTPSPQPQS